MREILYASNIILTLDDGAGSKCAWRQQEGEEGTLVVQVGDIVDRGEGASEAWQCLDELQLSANNGSSLVRLVGNHEVNIFLIKYHIITCLYLLNSLYFLY